MNNIRVPHRAQEHSTAGQKRFRWLLVMMIVCCAGISLASCSSVQGTKSDYFGFRNNIPAPAPEVEQEVSQQAWTNPMQSGVTSSVAFVPVVTPWYDGWSMFARPSARFWGAYDRFGWNSPWGGAGDPFFGGGYGYSGWGCNSWAMNSYYDPFWGYGSSFMFYSSPWQRYNPYFGAYTPFGFYRPLGWWSSQNFTSYNNNLNSGTVLGGNTDLYTPSRMRDAGVQRAYGNNASAYTGSGSYNNSTYIGSYTTNGATGGALMRGGQGTGAEYKQNNPNNRASQNTGYSVSPSDNAASNYSKYYSGTTTKYNNYNGSGETTRYYPTAPSTSGARSWGGYSGGSSSGKSSSYSGSSSYERGSSSSGGWGGKSSGGYSGGSSSSSGGSSSGGSKGSSSSGSSSGGSSGGGARSRGGN